MSVTDYNARLYEKMKAEQDKYRDWLLHQEPSEILNHTYECHKAKQRTLFDNLELTELKARDTSCPKGKKVELRRIKTIGI